MDSLDAVGLEKWRFMDDENDCSNRMLHILVLIFLPLKHKTHRKK